MNKQKNQSKLRSIFAINTIARKLSLILFNVIELSFIIIGTFTFKNSEKS